MTSEETGDALRAGAAYEAYVRGDSLTDEQVEAVIKTFPPNIRFLRACGPRFDLAATELTMKYHAFVSFAQHRGLKVTHFQ